MAAAAILVLTSLPDADTARRLARGLIEARLAACVQVGAPVESLYHWQGRLETANEIPLVIKTTAAAWPALLAAIRERHPYELPEIVAVPIIDGLPGYLDWIDAQTRPE
ncbi:MAG: divalent-cation tolerance protein CutA [Burkholderiales bacterium]|nr:divalent-cation tolerance protein CutA [Burkholderiales bacterium]